MKAIFVANRHCRIFQHWLVLHVDGRVGIEAQALDDGPGAVQDRLNQTDDHQHCPDEFRRPVAGVPGVPDATDGIKVQKPPQDVYNASSEVGHRSTTVNYRPKCLT